MELHVHLLLMSVLDGRNWSDSRYDYFKTGESTLGTQRIGS